ncbi:hypothetical protein [Lacipirellula sp.]|uniref:hypothetical protein n=1 Tax=Lacipirellula sp. TaxID=2691419 RepID=UPI003D117CAC
MHEDDKGGKPSIAREIDAFMLSVESLSVSLPFMLMVLKGLSAFEHQRLGKYLGANCTLKGEEGATQTYQVPAHLVGEVRRIERKSNRYDKSTQTVPRSLLVALVSQFDYFLGRLVRCLYEIRPSLLEASERSLTLAQLQELSSIEEAKEYLIEKDIETLLRKSHVEQFEWLEQKFGIPLRKDLPSWPKFVEVTQRRNLFAHCNGVVSSQYLIVCKNASVTFEGTPPKLNESLECTPAYFREAYACIFEIAVKLGQVLWRKLAPADVELADVSIIDVSFELLVAEQYGLLIRILDFFTLQNKKFSSELNRRIMVINHAQAHKWSGDNAGAIKILDKEDWSAAAAKFQLCEAVLRDNFDRAVELMRQIGKDGEVAKTDYEDWPCFKEFRNSPEFTKAYCEIFGTEFELKKTEKLTALHLQSEFMDDPELWDLERLNLPIGVVGERRIIAGGKASDAGAATSGGSGDIASKSESEPSQIATFAEMTRSEASLPQVPANGPAGAPDVG